MKKILNDPYRFVDEMLMGILRAHGAFLKAVPGNNRAIIRTDSPIEGKVAIVTGGGSGHLPVFLGYVGAGLADGVAVGNVFSSPSADQILAVTRAVNADTGVLYLYGNYSGDSMNFSMAAEIAQTEGIHVESVVVSDDIASAPKEHRDRRRGVAGLFFAYKIAGARAQEKASLGEVKEVALKAVRNTCSIGVALSPCTVPAAGKPTFSIADDEMEIGMGIHGEPGVLRGPLLTADEITEDLAERLLEDLPYVRGDEVSVLVNSLGATPLEELYIIYRRLFEVLGDRGIQIQRTYVGRYATSLEMAGCSVSLLRLDDELKRLLYAPAESPFFVQVR